MPVASACESASLGRACSGRLGLTGVSSWKLSEDGSTESAGRPPPPTRARAVRIRRRSTRAGDAQAACDEALHVNLFPLFAPFLPDRELAANIVARVRLAAGAAPGHEQVGYTLGSRTVYATLLEGRIVGSSERGGNENPVEGSE